MPVLETIFVSLQVAPSILDHYFGARFPLLPSNSRTFETAKREEV